MNRNKNKSYRKAKNKNKEKRVSTKVIAVFLVLNAIVTFLNDVCELLKSLLELLFLF